MIHVYWFTMDQELISDHHALGLLDAQERDQFRRIENNALARFFAYRRGVLRMVLAKHLMCTNDSLRFTTNTNGKPRLDDPETRIHFSTSQTGNCGVVAVCSQGPIGVDVEAWRKIDASSFAKSILSAQEKRHYESVDPGAQIDTLLRAWTAKEAVIKGLGLGLELALLPQISIASDALDQPWANVELPSSLSDSHRWYVSRVAGEEMSPGLFPNAAFLSIASPLTCSVEVKSASAFVG